MPYPERGVKCALDDCHWIRSHVVVDLDGDLHDLCERHTVDALEAGLVVDAWAISDIIKA